MLNDHPFIKELRSLNSKIDRLVRLIERSNLSQDKIFTSERLKTELGVSSKTLQKWRDYKLIRYSKIGNKFYYSKKDVDDLLNDHRIAKSK